MFIHSLKNNSKIVPVIFQTKNIARHNLYIENEILGLDVEFKRFRVGKPKYQVTTSGFTSFLRTHPEESTICRPSRAERGENGGLLKFEVN